MKWLDKFKFKAHPLKKKSVRKNKMNGDYVSKNLEIIIDNLNKADLEGFEKITISLMSKDIRSSFKVGDTKPLQDLAIELYKQIGKYDYKNLEILLYYVPKSSAYSVNAMFDGRIVDDHPGYGD